MSNNKKILLVGGALSENHGAEAMSAATINLLKENFSDTDIYVSSPIKRDLILGGKFGVDVIYEQGTYLGIMKYLIKSLFYKITTLKPNHGYLKHFSECDLIIDLSGDTFSDVYSKGVLTVAWRHIIAGFFKKELIIFPQTIGPFNKLYSKILARYMIGRAKKVYVREKISYAYLRKFTKQNKKIKFCLDSAFFLEPSNEVTTYEVLFKKNNLLHVGLSVSNSIVRYSKNTDKSDLFRKYIDEMTRTVEYISLNYESVIIMIPHVIDTIRDLDDDRIAQNKVYNKLTEEAKSKTIVINEDLDASMLKKIIGSCDIFIGSRMHSNIAALSSNVPTISISYSQKYTGIMELFDLNEYVVDIQSIESELVINLINRMLKQKKVIKKNLLTYNQKKKELYRQELINTISFFLYPEEAD